LNCFCGFAVVRDTSVAAGSTRCATRTNARIGSIGEVSPLVSYGAFSESLTPLFAATGVISLWAQRVLPAAAVPSHDAKEQKQCSLLTGATKYKNGFQ